MCCTGSRKIKSDVSLREFFKMIEDLLPGEEGFRVSIEEKHHPPASLSKAVSNFTEADKRSIAVVRRKLLDQEQVLRKCTLKLKIKKGRWWKIDDSGQQGQQQQAEEEAQ